MHFGTELCGCPFHTFPQRVGPQTESRN